MAEDFNKDVRELSEEELLEISGGRGGGKKLCPKGTRRVCATRNGKYSCICEPYAPTPAPVSEPEAEPAPAE